MVYIILAILIFWGFSSNLYIGIAVSAISLGFIVYKALPAYFAIMGNRAYSNNNIEKTIKYYDKAIASRRVKSNFCISYLLILMKTGEMDKALQLANKLIVDNRFQENEKNIIKEYRCLIFYKQGNAEEALEDAREIYEHFKNTTIYSLLGYLMLACNEPIEETFDFCLKAYDYNSDDRDIVDNMVLAYYKTGDYKKAEELADELIESNPNFVEAHYHCALIAKALGKKEKAISYLENMDNCVRTALTTVSEEEIDILKKELQGEKNDNI